MAIEAVAVVGPTASGKTGRAVALARMMGGEVISADSRQVYRDMTLGTGKDLEEYGDVPYHLIDIRDAGEKYNLCEYLKDFRNAYREVISRCAFPVICGGSGMYVETALCGVSLPEVPADPELRERLGRYTLVELVEILKGYKTLHNTTDVDTVKRAVRAIEIAEYYRCHPEEAALADRSLSTPVNALVVGVDIPREERRRRISERLERRLDAGMLDEVKALLDRGIAPEDLIYYGLEYKFMTLHLIGRLGYDEMFRQLEIAIHQFAKRQMTWFRGMERRGFHIEWLPYDLSDDEFAVRVMSMVGSHS